MIAIVKPSILLSTTPNDKLNAEIELNKLSVKPFNNVVAVLESLEAV